MITLKYSMKQTVNVGKGLYQNWQRVFQLDDVYRPEGWEHSLSINNQMVTFAFAHVSNAKIKADNYIVVTVRGLFRNSSDVTRTGSDVIYICPVMSILRPFPKELENAERVLGFLEAVAVTKFTEQQAKAWIAEKKLSIC